MKILMMLAGLIVTWTGLAYGAGPGKSGDGNDARTLDANVQAVKKDVTELTRDLMQLQNDLLAPASTRVTVFVSVDNQASFVPDSIQLQIDGKVLANYLYTAREQDALKRGGVQQLYTGNVSVGEHRLAVTLLGQDTARGTASASFTKELGAKYVELKVGGASKQPTAKVKEW